MQRYERWREAAKIAASAARPFTARCITRHTGSDRVQTENRLMFQTFAVTYALMKIGVEAGHPDFGIYFPKQIKRSAIKQAKESNRGWGKWQIAMFIISTTRLLAKKGKLIDKKHSQVKVDMKAMIALDEIYEVGMKKLKERNLDRDCVVTRV
jgi:hypothetical protein